MGTIGGVYHGVVYHGGGQCTMVAGVVYHGYVGTTTWYYLPGWVGTTMGVVGGHGVCHGVGVGVPCGTWGGGSRCMPWVYPCGTWVCGLGGGVVHG